MVINVTMKRKIKQWWSI